MAGHSTHAKQLKVMEQSRRVYEQEGKISLYFRARKELIHFFQLCSSAREAYASGNRETTIQHELLSDLVTAHENALLVLVPLESRAQLCAQASRTASRHAQALGDTDWIWLAELTLRKLMILCLKTVSQAYRGKFRLPEWDRRIIAGLCKSDRLPLQTTAPPASFQHLHGPFSIDLPACRESSRSRLRCLWTIVYNELRFQLLRR